MIKNNKTRIFIVISILVFSSIFISDVSTANMTSDTKAVTSVQDAVYLTADQVLAASDQGTFSVGGVLMDTDGNVIHSLHNNVVKNGLTADPTAHGERQMIDWYYENKETLSLPEPEELVLVTSLDPCLMCTGAILESGIHTVVSANDDYAGINFDDTATFPSLTGTSMLADAESQLSYPAVVGPTDKYSRPATGAPVPAVFTSGATINDQTYALTSTAFDATLGQVSAAINTDLPENALLDPKTLPDNDPIVLAMKSVYPHALEYTAPTPGQPDEGLAPYLIDAAHQDILNGGEGNAVAYLDRFGNLIMCLPGNQGVSAIQTPFMNTTRAYAQLRYDLQMSGISNAKTYLGHPKYGSFIYAKGLEINPRGLIDLGAFGSTMEGAIPSDREQFQYGVERVPQPEFQAFVDQLPPFYSSDESVNVHTTQVADPDLIAALEAGLPATP